MNAAAIEEVPDRPPSDGVTLQGTQLTLGAIVSGGAGVAKLNGPAKLPIQVISQFGSPRWVLPAEEKQAISVLRSWRPYSIRSRVKWSAVVGACRFGALKMLPGVSCHQLRCDFSYWRRHLPGYSDSLAVVAYIGNPSPTRKAILFFVDGNAEVRAVVKVPIQPAAKTAILNEATVLKKVRNRLPVPLVLFADEAEGIAAQSWVQGTNVSRTFGRKHHDLLMRLASNGAYVRLTDCRNELEMRIASLRRFSDASLLDRALSLLNIEEEMRGCVEHGDFTPWNLRRTTDGNLTPIDWEWSVEAGFPWQDICRYFYLQAYLFRDHANIWGRLTTHPLLAEYRRNMNLSPEAVRGLTVRFLLRLLCNSYEEGDLQKVGFAAAKMRELLSG